MSRSRRRRREAAAGQAFELLCLFFMGFLASSVIGIALAWMLGMHHPEPHPLDEDSRETIRHAEGKVAWLLHADPPPHSEYGG